MLSANNGGRSRSMWMLVSALLAAIVISTGATGCASKDKQAQAKKEKKPESFHPDFFGPESEQRTVDRFVEVQAAEGAKEDAMLFGSHFDGDELNTAGQVKLSLMLRNHSPRQPLIVYMALPPNDPFAAGRRSAVEDFVRQSGIAVAKLDLRDGDNPDLRTNAARNLANLPKTDSGPRAGGAAGGIVDERTGTGGTGDTAVDMSGISR